MRKRITRQDQTGPLSSSPSVYHQSAHDYAISVQVASEKAELLAALIEYEKDINLLESLYNNNKELLDQHELNTDLKELAEYASFLVPRSPFRWV
jgi:hypothetical protein